MKLVLTLLVRDEEDILAENLAYHLSRGVDFVVATDNLSVDGTREILESYRRQGVLHYLFEPQDDYAQSRWVTRMARIAAEDFAADWVIHGDADEFWWPERAGDLKEALREAPAEAFGLRVPRHNFVPSARTSEVGFVDAMIHREVSSRNALGEPLPPKVCHRASRRVRVGQGNHSVELEGRESHLVPTDALSILHYPMRTLAQFRNKIDKGGAAYGRSTLPPEAGHVWRTLARRSREDGLSSFFEEHLLDEGELSRALSEGRLVEDTRLRRYFRRRDLRRKSHVRPAFLAGPEGAEQVDG